MVVNPPAAESGLICKVTGLAVLTAILKRWEIIALVNLGSGLLCWRRTGSSSDDEKKLLK